ncbi:MAG: DUF3150 domain-containing protein [Thalassotalea sp.]|nr:DUF3150 domain-containing protein [Thalassotalea sp.]
MSIIKGMTMCYLNISNTTGRKKLLPDDVKIPSGYNIKELTRLGTKTVFDQKALRPFENVRKQSYAFLDQIGVRHQNGWLIPDSRLTEVDNKMESFAAQFNSNKVDLITNYEATKDAWLAEVEALNAELKTIIEENLISRDYLMGQIQFGFTREEEEVQHVVSNLVKETAHAAKTSIDRLIAKGAKTKLDRRSLTNVIQIRDKLDSMVFLNPSIEATVDRINRFLSAIPKNGPLGISHYQDLIIELTFLSDPANYRILQSQNTIEIEEGVADIAQADDEIQRAIKNAEPIEEGDVSIDDIDPSILDGEEDEQLLDDADSEGEDIDKSILEDEDKAYSGGWF